MAASVWMKFWNGDEPELVAVQRADDACRHRLADVEGVADGQHRVAHLQRAHVAERHHGQAVEVDLEHRDVGLGVAADQPCARLAAVGELHLDFGRRPSTTWWLVSR